MLHSNSIRLPFILLLLVILSACGNSSSGGDPAPITPVPTITSFTAAATTITLGNSTTLTGVFANGTG